VIAGSHLETWTVTAPDPHALSQELETAPGVDMVAPFGNRLHVSGRNPKQLEQTLEAFKARVGLTFERAEPSLEDVFIDLMQRSRDNFEQAQS